METVPNPTKPMLIIGWICIFAGMLLPIVVLMTAAWTMFFAFPICCIILVLGLFIVAGRFPPQRASSETANRQDAKDANRETL